MTLFTSGLRSRALVTGAALLFMAACHTERPSPSAAAEGQRSIKKIGIAYALGGKGDQSYNDAAMKGNLRLRESGVEVIEFEPSTMDDYTKGLDLLSLRNLDVIFCVGFLYDEPVRRVADKHSRTTYVVLDGSVTGSNAASAKFDAKEGSFLAGAVAAGISKTGKLGFIGGADIPVINEFLDGYRLGALFQKEKAEVIPLYIGSGGSAFTDPVRGKEVALSLIGRGADVLFSAAGSSGNGVLRAAQEANVLAIGVDVDQSHVAPRAVVTSMVKNFDAAMVFLVSRLRNGDAIAGKVHLLGLKDGAVGLSAPRSDLAQTLGPIIERAKQHLLAGSGPK